MKTRKFIPLNLQYFAGGDVDPNKGEVKKTIEAKKTDEVKQTDEVNKTEPKEEPTDKKEDVITLTQAELNKIITDRLTRDRKAKEEEDAEKALKEQGEYKELYEQSMQSIAEMKAEKAKAERDAEIVKTLKSQGLNDEQVQAHFKWVEKSVGEEDSIEEVVKEYVSNFKVDTSVDPSGGFGATQKPKPKDDENIGQELLDRARAHTKVKL